MVEDSALWDVELGFWLKGASHYGAHLHPDCVFAFPQPTGLMQGNGFVDGIGEISPWASAEFHEQTVSRPAPALAVLSYRAVGARKDGRTYSAFCTTTYMMDDNTPVLVQHQQTPIED